MKKYFILFLAVALFAVAVSVSVFVSLYSINQVSMNKVDALMESESPVEHEHQTVVPCGGEHPRFWKKGCCEGSGSCSNECDKDYSC